MADFCKVCSGEMFPENIEPDYDFEAIAETLEPGQEYHILCEGCGAAILKIMDGKLYIQYANEVEWIEYSESETLNRFEENLRS